MEVRMGLNLDSIQYPVNPVYECLQTNCLPPLTSSSLSNLHKSLSYGERYINKTTIPSSSLFLTSTLFLFYSLSTHSLHTLKINLFFELSYFFNLFLTHRYCWRSCLVCNATHIIKVIKRVSIDMLEQNSTYSICITVKYNIHFKVGS